MRYCEVFEVTSLAHVMFVKLDRSDCLCTLLTNGLSRHSCQRSNNTVFEMYCTKPIRSPEFQLCVCVCVVCLWTGFRKPKAKQGSFSQADRLSACVDVSLPWVSSCPFKPTCVFLLTAIVPTSLLSRSFWTASQNTQSNIIVVFEMDFQWSHSSIHELCEKKKKNTLWTWRHAEKRIKKEKKHMNLNETLLQPWWPNHVTNQTLPSHLSKSNWPFPTAQLCDTNSAPRALPLSFSFSLSLYL